MLHFSSAFQFSLSHAWSKITTSFSATPGSCRDRLIEGAVIRAVQRTVPGSLPKTKIPRSRRIAAEIFGTRIVLQHSKLFACLRVSLISGISWLGAHRVPSQLCVPGLIAVTTKARFYARHNWKLLQHELVWRTPLWTNGLSHGWVCILNFILERGTLSQVCKRHARCHADP